MHEIVGLEAFPLSIEFQSLQDHIKTDLIPVFEAVGKGLFRIVNFYRNAGVWLNRQEL
jgi:hypothetical protein